MGLAPHSYHNQGKDAFHHNDGKTMYRSRTGICSTFGTTRHGWRKNIHEIPKISK